jgi:hypothetical protein
MTKLSKDELREIIAQQMPKYKLVDTPTPPGAADGATTRAKPEGHTPGLDTLRKKYLRDKFLSDAPGGGHENGEPNGHRAAAAAAADAGEDDTEIVIVEPKVAPHPLDRGSRPKAIVISTIQKKIVGEQG